MVLVEDMLISEAVLQMDETENRAKVSNYTYRDLERLMLIYWWWRG